MLQYKIGDATNPVGTDPRIIVHCCNDVGGWGAGFVLALSRKWSEPEERYRKWFDGTRSKPKLGDVQLVEVAPTLWVANLIGQHKTGYTNGVPPIRYGAVEEGLSTVATLARALKASVHMPRMGAGLAGGDWRVIEETIKRTLVADGVDVTVYDLP